MSFEVRSLEVKCLPVKWSQEKILLVSCLNATRLVVLRWDFYLVPVALLTTQYASSLSGATQSLFTGAWLLQIFSIECNEFSKRQKQWDMEITRESAT